MMSGGNVKRNYVVVGDNLFQSLHSQFDQGKSVSTGKRDGTNRRLFRDPVRFKIFDMHALSTEVISVSQLATIQAKAKAKEGREGEGGGVKELHSFVFPAQEWSVDLLVDLQRDGFVFKEWLYGAKEEKKDAVAEEGAPTNNNINNNTRLRVIGQKYAHKRDPNNTRTIIVEPGPQCNDATCTQPSAFFCRCSSATYCSRDCYARDWNMHKLTCSANP
jgi:hypothetical protein